MTIEELFAIIKSAYSQGTLTLPAARLPGSPAEEAIKTHFENGTMILQRAAQPVIRDGAVVIDSGAPDKLLTLPRAAAAVTSWTIAESRVHMHVQLTPEGQAENGVSLKELYPKLEQVYVRNYRFTGVKMEINSRLPQYDLNALQKKYAEGLYHPAPGTFYSGQLGFKGKLRWPEALLPLQEIFGKDGFEASGYFQSVNGMPRYFIDVNGTAIRLGNLNIATHLELSGLLLDSTDEPKPDTQPEADTLQALAGVFSLPGEIAPNRTFRFETFWQLSVPENFTIRSERITNVPGLLKDLCKQLLGVEMPEWQIPGLPLAEAFNLEYIEIVFNRKALKLISINVGFSLQREQGKFTLIENMLELDKITIDLSITGSGSFSAVVGGALSITGVTELQGPIITEITLPACSFRVGLGEFSTFNAGALIRRAIPWLPELNFVIGDLLIEGNVRNRSCSFMMGLEPGSSIDFFLFKLEEFYFWFEYGNSNFVSAKAQVDAILSVSENLEIGLRGTVDSEGWTLEGSLLVEEKVYLDEFLPAGTQLPEEFGRLSFKSAEVVLKRGKESGVSFALTELFEVSLGDWGNFSIDKLSLEYTSSGSEYEWKIICGGTIALVKENPTDKPWLIHGSGELLITKRKGQFEITFESKEGIAVEKLPLLIPYAISGEGIEWSLMKFTLKKISLRKTEEKKWVFESAFTLHKVRLPSVIDSFFPAEGIAVKLEIGKGRVSIEIEKSFIDYTTKAIIIPKVGELPAFNLGTSRIIFGGLKLVIAKKVSVECKLKYWLPERTNYLFGTDGAGNPKIKLFDTFNPASRDTGKTLEVTFYGRSDSTIGASISQLPLLPLKEEGGYYLFNLGPVPPGQEYGAYGCLKFKMPEFYFDPKKGGFTLSADFGIQKMLAIPLKPFKEVLRNGKTSWADRLPDSIPVPFPYNPGIFKDNKLNVQKAVDFFELLMGRKMTPEERKPLDDLAAAVKPLPNALKQYLTLNDPEGKFELKFKFTITAKGGFDITLSANPGLKMLSLNPPFSVQGIVLRSFSFGTLLGGQLFSTRIDADFEQFDIVQLATALFAPTDAYEYLGTPEDYGTKLTLEELFIVIIYQTQIPIPIPIFYKRLAIDYYGIGDFAFEGGISFKEPEFDLFEAAGMLSDVIRFFANKNFLFDPDTEYERFTLKFAVLPTFVTLPQKLGGRKYGFVEGAGAPSVYRIFASIANTIKTQDLEHAVKILPLSSRFKVSDDRSPAQMGCLHLPQLDWILSTPAEFIKEAHRKLNLNVEQANQWLEIIPGATDTTPVRPDTKGIIVYLRGKWGAAYAGETGFDCIFGLIAVSVRQFRLGLSIRGKVSGLFDFEAKAFANVGPKDPYFFIRGEGKTNIKLIGLEIFKGQSSVTISKNYFSANGHFHILEETALLYIGGGYEGNFDAAGFHLKGGLTGKLLIFALDGEGRIASNGIGGSIGFVGAPRTGFDITISGQLIAFRIELNLGWTVFSSSIKLQPNNNDPILDLDMMSASLAGLLRLQVTFYGRAFTSTFDGKFILYVLDQRVLNGWAKIEGPKLAAGGRLLLSLIPGTELDVELGGSINESGFSFTGSGKLRVQGLPSTDCSLTVSPQGIRGDVTILGVKYGLGFIVCRGDLIIILTALNITSYIDRDGFHFKKQPPCTDLLAGGTEPCRTNVSREVMLQELTLLDQLKSKIRAVRSSRFKQLAKRVRTEHTMTVFAGREKTSSKTFHRVLMVLKPKSGKTKLMTEIRRHILLNTQKPVVIDLSGAHVELEVKTDGKKVNSILRLSLPQGTGKKDKQITYKFSGLIPGYDFFRIAAKELEKEAKKKPALKKPALKKPASDKKKKAAKKKSPAKKQVTNVRSKKKPLKKLPAKKTRAKAKRKNRKKDG